MAQTLEELHLRLRPVTRPDETPDTLLEAAVNEIIARREREAARWEAARIQAQIDFMGPHRSHASATAEAYHRLGVPAPASPLDREERIRRAAEIADALPPEKIAELEGQGLL